MTIENIEALRTHIETTLRTEQSNIKKIEYVEINNNRKTIVQENNYVVWGRRGSGKTTLLRQIPLVTDGTSISVYLDCKPYKNHTYPDLLLKLLIRVFEEIDKSSRKGVLRIFQKKLFRNEIKELAAELKKSSDIIKIDREEETAKTSEASAQGDLPGKIKSQIARKSGRTVKEKYTYEDSKVQFLEKKMDIYRDLAVKALGRSGKKQMAILLDDYYYVGLEDQPYIIDYLHRVFYDTNIWLKVASNRYSSRLNQRTETGDRIGIVEGDDYLPIDLDFTLVKFNETEDFLKRILDNHARAQNIKDIEDWFSPDSFRRLVWCSGGVPRDFLNIVINVLKTLTPEKRIGVHQINEATQNYFEEKVVQIESDYERKNQIKDLFDKIFHICIEQHRRTGFLIENRTGAIDETQTFRDLIDHRLIHQIEKNVSSKRYSGKRFNGYILNVGSYVPLLRLKEESRPIEINIYKNPTRPIDSDIRSIANAITQAELDAVDLSAIEEAVKRTTIKKNNVKRGTPQPKAKKNQNLTLSRYFE